MRMRLQIIVFMFQKAMMLFPRFMLRVDMDDCVGKKFELMIPISSTLDPVPWYMVYFVQEETCMERFTIGRLAKQAGVNIETVRYYERRRLLPKPERSPSGYRQYSDDGVQRIRFIRHAQELGFSLKEIQGLLNLRINPGVTCADVEKRAEEKIVDIDRRITTLKRMRQVLFRLKTSCKGNVPSSECPILEALESV